MKKNLVFIVSFLFMVNIPGLYSQVNRTLSPGFSVNFIIGVPTGNYGWLEIYNLDDDVKFKTVAGFQIGNRWYFGSSEKFGIGMMVNWLDLTFSLKTIEHVESITSTHAVVDLSVVEIGPVGTLALSDKIAIDAYYNLRPSTVAHVYAYSNTSYEDTEDFESYAGLGFTHAVGTAFRWRVLNAGLEVVTGTIKISDSTFESLIGEKIVINNIRFMVGVKF